jgi:hypothetical protein
MDSRSVIGEGVVGSCTMGGDQEGIYGGGCDAKYGMGGAVAVLMLIASIILLYYLVRSEPVCGGKDQGCCCDGNEMMTGARTSANGVEYAGAHTEADWSRVMAGR